MSEALLLSPDFTPFSEVFDRASQVFYDEAADGCIIEDCPAMALAAQIMDLCTRWAAGQR